MSKGTKPFFYRSGIFFFDVLFRKKCSLHYGFNFFLEVFFIQISQNFKIAFGRLVGAISLEKLFFINRFVKDFRLGMDWIKAGQKKVQRRDVVLGFYPRKNSDETTCKKGGTLRGGSSGGKLGIVAGGGALPGALVQHCLKIGRPFFVLALKGHAEITLLPPDVPIQWIRLGAVGKGFSLLKAHNVREVVLIGTVRRPSVMELCPDWRGMVFFARLGLKALGDDCLLRAVINEIEDTGLKVRGIHELMPELLSPVGVLGRITPSESDWVDIKHGISIARLLGRADIGQAVIVQQGVVLSVEGIEGTEALINRTKALKRKGGGGVLVKVVKPNQERRVDLPTIGPKTVTSVCEAGFKGIAIEAQGVLIAKYSETIQKADSLGIFIVGIENG